MKIDFELPKDNKYHQFCPLCHSERINRIFEDKKTFYKCDDCGKVSPRMIVIDPQIIWWVDDAKEYWHESVGVFVFNKENKALFFERIIYPFAWTIPSGHLDIKESPDDAVRRELFEEVALRADELKLFVEEDIIGDECRRGADNHRWHLYVAKTDYLDTIKINDEGVRPVWLSIDEALGKELTYPVKFFINKYGHSLYL